MRRAHRLPFTDYRLRVKNCRLQGSLGVCQTSQTRLSICVCMYAGSGNKLRGRRHRRTWVLPATADVAADSTSAASLPAAGRLVDAAGGGADPSPALADAAALSAVAHRLSRSSGSL